jgi:uncharacterized protein (TIGR02246 family)
MRKNIVVALAAASLVACASTGGASNDRLQVEDGIDHFKAAFNEHDAARLADLYAENARILPHNAPMVTGKAGIQKFWQGAFNHLPAHIEKRVVEIRMIGDTAIETSTYVVTTRSGQKIVGKDMLVWQREPDGRWYITSDIWNTDKGP